MKSYKILLTGLGIALSILLLQKEGFTRIPEPDNIIYGLTGEGVETVTLKINGQEIASYEMGSNPDAGNYYILRIPLDDGYLQPQLPDTAIPGDLAEIYINDESLPAATATIGERGAIQELPLGPSPQYTLTISTVGSGDVTLDPDDVIYDMGTLVIMTAEADPGWAFTGWSGDLNTPNNPVTITMDSDKDVTATFMEDSDSDGVPDQEEQGPDGNDPDYDGNNNFIPDSEEASVASFHTHDGVHYVTLSISEGVLISVTAVENPSPDDAPEGVEFPYGFFSFTITGIELGGDTTATLILPDEGIAIDTYWKYGPTPDDSTPHWYEFLYDGETGAEINNTDHEILLHFVDAERGDNVLTEDGMIIEPGGPGVIIGTSDSDGDGIPDDGDDSGTPGDYPCTGGEIEGCDDNCKNTPNGPEGGTCLSGTIGAFCMSNEECGAGGLCSMDQEDTYPPGGNECGDVCECEGNFDPDGDVDGMDALTFKADFGRMDCDAGIPCNGDFDCNGVVDGTDAIMFKVDFGRRDCPSCTFSCY